MQPRSLTDLEPFVVLGLRVKGVRFCTMPFLLILAGPEGRSSRARHAKVISQDLTPPSLRDLIHLGVMLRHQIQEIVTADTGFDVVEEVRRIDPMMFS